MTNGKKKNTNKKNTNNNSKDQDEDKDNPPNFHKRRRQEKSKRYWCPSCPGAKVKLLIPVLFDQIRRISNLKSVIQNKVNQITVAAEFVKAVCFLECIYMLNQKQVDGLPKSFFDRKLRYRGDVGIDINESDSKIGSDVDDIEKMWGSQQSDREFDKDKLMHQWYPNITTLSGIDKIKRFESAARIGGSIVSNVLLIYVCFHLICCGCTGITK